jgi:hypothetical protein
MSYIQQFFTSRDNNANAETFVGQEGRLWWDPVTNQIYSSDGNTPGGIPLAGGSGGATNKIYNGSSYANIAAVSGNLVIGISGNIWNFDTAGSLTLPGGAVLRDSAINTLSIGNGAGNVTNAQDGALAIGWLAGTEGQGYDAVAIGSSAGGSDGFQGESAVAVGASAGANLQSPYAVAIGTAAGQFAQGSFSVAIGYGTGLTSQGASAVAIGTGAGNTSQGNATIAVGTGAGSITQGPNAVAIGTGAGTNKQGDSAVAVGALAGNGGSFSTDYISGAVSPSTTLVVASTTDIVPGMIISGTGFTGNQTVVTVIDSTTLAISAPANSTPSGSLSFNGSQGLLAVAVGNSAGQVQQSQYAVAIGTQAGKVSQGTISVAVGYLSGVITQGSGAVAVGGAAGAQLQGQLSVAVGQSAGYINQGILAVAVGPGAGISGQGSNTVAIGTYAAGLSQGTYAVAVGAYAGNASQGNAAVAIGSYAGATNQGNNSIILNATGANLDQTTANTFTVAPVRNDVANIGNVMFYNATSKEITYGNVISVAGNITGGNVIGTTGVSVGGTGGDLTMTGGAITGVGNITSNGIMAINAPGGITTTAGSFDIVNATATTVNIGGSATAVNVGAITGTVTINNPTIVGTQTSLTLFNTTASNISAFGAASNLILGATSGTMTLRNPTIVGTQATQTLFNTVATTVNFAGAATTLNIGGAGNATFSANTQVRVSNTGGSALSVAGNVTGGNLLTGGSVSATGNIGAGGNPNYYGFATTTKAITVVAATSGYAAVDVVGSAGNAGSVNFGNVGTRHASIDTDSTRTLYLNVNVLGTGNAVSQAVAIYPNLNASFSNAISATANITGGNVLSNGQLSTAGNITGGNITVGGAMTAVGNIAANWVNGAYYTGTWGTNFVSTGNVSGTNITTAGLISAAGNVTGGNLISTGAVYSNYNTNTANTGSFMAQGGNTKGGTGYLDFLVAQNTSGGATNPYKWLRTTSDGQLQIINSAYTTNIFNLSDAGAFSVPGPISVSGKQAVNGPAFSAYAAAVLQTITPGSQQKVLFQTEEFDTNSNYTNSIFTPTVEGYYQLNAEVRLDGASGTGEMMIVIWKNGAGYKRGTNQQGTQIAANFWAMQVSSVVYANGTTDYFEIYVQQGSGGNVSVTAVNDPSITWFNGCMLRGA